MASTVEDPGPRAPEDIHVLETGTAGPAVVRGAVIRLGSFVTGSLFTVGAAALLFRHLGVTDTGRYTTAMSLSAIATGFTDFGLTGIAVRELSVVRGPRMLELTRNLLGMRIVLTTAGVLVVAGFAVLVYGTLLGLGVLIAGAGVVITNTQGLLAIPLAVRLRLGAFSALELARQVTIAAVILLLVLVGAHLLGFLAVPAIGALLVLPPTVVLIRGEIPLRPSFDLSIWRSLLTPMLAYSAAVITSTVYLRIALVLVSIITGSRQLGYFSISFRVVENLLILPGLLVGSAFPIFAYAAQSDLARLGYAISRVFDAALIVGVWVSLSLCVGARLVVQLIGGASFRGADPILAVEGIAVAAVFVSTIWGCALLGLHLHRTILVVNLAMVVVMALAVSVMTLLYAAEGAAIAVAAVETATAVVTGLALVRGRPVLRPRLGVVPKVAVAAAVGIVPMVMTGVPVIARMSLSSVLYLGTLFLVGGISPALIESIIDLKGRS